ncbi:MAG: Crp/Fnr family transcriptional regulator [Candidatus Shapirobacteria bacterium]|nr:Crp/Fnr family transcriptional regulator [Candidatus Shapirobacteria bacterium]
MEQIIRKKLEGFFCDYPLKSFKKGEIILRPGEEPTGVGFIKSGYIRLYTVTESGQEITMEFFKPLLFLTTILALTSRENKFYFEAITPVEIYEAPNKEFLEYLEKNTDVAQELNKNIMTAFLDLMDNTANLLAGNAYSRVAMMVYSLTNRAEGFGITHKLIASLTGLTRETVTLQMIKLEKQGLIVNKSKSIQVINKEKLIKAAKVT